MRAPLRLATNITQFGAIVRAISSKKPRVR
jgi:hypothetical protein